MSTKSSLMLTMFVAIFLGLISCKVKEVEYLAVEKVENVKIGFPNSSAQVFLKVFNPNSFNLTLDSLQGVILDKEDVIGHVENLGKPVLSAKDSCVLPLKLSIKTGGAALSLIRNLQNGGSSSTSSSTKLGGFGVVSVWGIKHKIEIDKPFISK